MFGRQLCGVRPLMKTSLKIGTRSSKLALWQANWVKSTLTGSNPARGIELVTIKTKGDKILDVPLAKVGGKGLFVKEIEQALLDHRIDLAVHSMKDMPSEIPDGLCIGAIPQREVASDVLIARTAQRFRDLRRGAVIGTSSLRRAAQLRHSRPDIEIAPLRGNLDTRLKKLETENLDAIVLAAAGVKRLELEHRITEYLASDVMLPAVGQGALCIETRRNDPITASMMRSLDDARTRAVVLGERAFLKRLGGSCQVPIAGYGDIQDDIFKLTGLVAEIDGSRIFKAVLTGAADASESVGIRLAEELMSRGADKVLQKLQATESGNENG